jgi:hypothetical protein
VAHKVDIGLSMEITDAQGGACVPVAELYTEPTLAHGGVNSKGG